jgi:hypothetical protein
MKIVKGSTNTSGDKQTPARSEGTSRSLNIVSNPINLMTV